VISIGTTDALFYCFPKEGGDIASKTRLAAEELYKLSAPHRSRSRENSLHSIGTEPLAEKMT
ncbi:MAG: hypothetical protein IKK75_08585, partial [Clostridia bacterium]|nr:hypothetical protein [Clostridia bacterium]